MTLLLVVFDWMSSNLIILKDVLDLRSRDINIILSSSISHRNLLLSLKWRLIGNNWSTFYLSGFHCIELVVASLQFGIDTRYRQTFVAGRVGNLWCRYCGCYYFKCYWRVLVFMLIGCRSTLLLLQLAVLYASLIW